MTAAIPVTRFGERVLAQSANPIAVSKFIAVSIALLMMESNLIQARKNPIDHIGIASILRQIF